MRIIFFIFFASCSSVKTNVLIYPQWHLSSSTLTNKIQESTHLPQFENQKFIYQELKKQVIDHKLDLILSEGCEGEINHHFIQKFNGWDYLSLDQQKKSNAYDDILTLLPLKLEVYFKEQIFTLCADSESLIKKQLMSFSDLRAYVGYYHRLKEFKNNPKKYNLYAEGLLTNELKNKNINAIDYAKIKAQDSLNAFLKAIDDRNMAIISQIENYKGKNIALVIGQLHLKGLEELLLAKNINYSVVPVQGLSTINPWSDVDELKNILK